MAKTRLKDRRTGREGKDTSANTGKDKKSAKAERGRPKKFEEPPVKASISLREDQIVQLDQWCLDIRKEAGAILKRSEIIRAMVDAIHDSQMVINAVGSEEELKELLEARLTHE